MTLQKLCLWFQSHGERPACSASLQPFGWNMELCQSVAIDDSASAISQLLLWNRRVWSDGCGRTRISNESSYKVLLTGTLSSTINSFLRSKIHMYGARHRWTDLQQVYYSFHFNHCKLCSWPLPTTYVSQFSPVRLSAFWSLRSQIAPATSLQSSMWKQGHGKSSPFPFSCRGRSNSDSDSPDMQPQLAARSGQLYK